ncbi:hypothetical protein [Mucilaginibacter phyllosphaerae]|uniref:Ig-like domain-containing protein n=1 Tax=Mucilaginibacter phyllosphaerae TaxID=1812349 RepID=A0A4Y8AD58_9SPHI|nr:hypothetical protein [Mucilaginibacter phyllosphaerae]MBB3970171.1 hypothetical protein [Mucilaginibacter phyllosphaerae]TEW66556.1 hypothetical protein E2R65_09020 [Mucilaginibacter phyllosphaerae]GGH10243.1 hypothetical protein GCM10007352_16000 [Mucilaginibacter phyllosphaerae]
MKKNLIYSLIAGILLTGLLSFTIIKVNKKATPLPAKKTGNVKAKKFACSCVITGISNSGTTFTWTTNSQPVDHFNYGGYYQAGGTFSGSTYSPPVSISYKSGGGRFSVTPICADGSSGTSMNILF